ncbi:MAG TPA: WXG100 family type VII secretion target [Demequinaceae bacterium]
MLYHVDAAEVSSAAGRAAASAETIRGEVASLIAHLESLQGTWQGGAAQAFTGMLTQWRSAQAQLELALDGMSTGLSQAASQYDAAEQSAARLFAR